MVWRNLIQQVIKKLNSRISFVGHSLGGLIIRAAIPNLKEYSKKLFCYISLCTPHLGYIFTKSKLVDVGEIYE